MGPKRPDIGRSTRNAKKQSLVRRQETEAQRVRRNVSNRLRIALARQNETPEEYESRLKRGRIRMRQKRASLSRRIARQTNHRPIIKLEGPPSIFLNKIPALIKPTLSTSATNSLKRLATTPAETLGKTPKYPLQLGDAISSLPPTTIIKATTRPVTTYPNNSINKNSNTTGAQIATNQNSKTNLLNQNARLAIPGTSNTSSMRPTTVFIKREMPRRTMRSMTLELIEKNPILHLGVSRERFPILKPTICTITGVSYLDCCITLKKMRQNEPFELLAEYFEMTVAEVEQIFVRTVTRLARYMRFLIRWPDSKHYYERHKYMPFAYRAQLSQVQSLIECVETDVNEALNVGFSSYKFIYCISSNGIISYISDAYRGDCDDLMLFEACNFKAIIPKYLTLVSDPGKAIPRRRDDTKSSTTSEDDLNNEESIGTEPISKYDAQRVVGDMASAQSLHIIDDNLTSSRAKDLRIPTVNMPTGICRDQIRDSIDTLREFRILQPCAIQQPLLFEYINEILTLAAALINLQR